MLVKVLFFASKLNPSHSRCIVLTKYSIEKKSKYKFRVADPVIQANGILTFEDDLRSRGLLYFTRQ